MVKVTRINLSVNSLWRSSRHSPVCTDASCQLPQCPSSLDTGQMMQLCHTSYLNDVTLKQQSEMFHFLKFFLSPFSSCLLVVSSAWSQVERKREKETRKGLKDSQTEKCGEGMMKSPAVWCIRGQLTLTLSQGLTVHYTSMYLVLGASPRGACGLRQGMDMMLMLRYRPWLVVQDSSPSAPTNHRQKTSKSQVQTCPSKDRKVAVLPVSESCSWSLREEIKFCFTHDSQVQSESKNDTPTFINTYVLFPYYIQTSKQQLLIN